jgi:hypothetical protein
MSGEHIMKVGQQQRRTAVLLVPFPISSVPDIVQSNKESD